MNGPKLKRRKINYKDINSKIAVQGNEIKHLHADVEEMRKDIEDLTNEYYLAVDLMKTLDDVEKFEGEEYVK